MAITKRELVVKIKKAKHVCLLSPITNSYIKVYKADLLASINELLDDDDKISDSVYVSKSRQESKYLFIRAL